MSNFQFMNVVKDELKRVKQLNKIAKELGRGRVNDKKIAGDILTAKMDNMTTIINAWWKVL